MEELLKWLEAEKDKSRDSYKEVITSGDQLLMHFFSAEHMAFCLCIDKVKELSKKRN